MAGGCNYALARSGLWTAGTLAYQIYGGENPFYGQASASLDSRTFTSTMLPPLPDNTPWLVSMLESSMLSRNPGDRPTARLAATICHLLMWVPSSNPTNHLFTIHYLAVYEIPPSCSSSIVSREIQRGLFKLSDLTQW